LARTRELLRPYSGRLAAVVGLSTVASIGEAVGLSLFSVLLNQFLAAKPSLPVPGVLGGFTRLMATRPHAFFALLALTYIGRSALTLVANYAGVAVALTIADEWRMRLFRALFAMPLRGVPSKQGVTLQLVVDEPIVAGNGLAAGGLLIQNLMSAGTIYATLLWLSPSTTLLLTCVAGVSFLVLLQVFRYSRRLGARRSEVYRDGYGYLTETIGALRQVKLFGLEKRIEKRVEELVKVIRGITRRTIVVSSSPRVIIELVFVIVFALVLAILSSRMDQAALFGTAGLAGVAAMRLLPSFSAAAGIWVQVQQAVPAMNRIAEELEKLEALVEPPAPGAVALPGPSKAIELTDVTFAYPGRPAVLRDIDLTIEAGRFTALIGPSGSGKSTLLELICGLYDPEQGRILIDGTDLRAANKAVWRQRLGIVPQDGFLMSGTVRENLLLLRPDCPEDVLARAVDAVGATEIIAALPAGYDTVIGERGASLSGGQRQRLALARVLVKEPDVLMLDEATSALDATSDESIFRALESYRGKMTIIAVAHRLASVRHADRIFFLADGAIIESGDHEGLIARNGSYAALYRASERTGKSAPDQVPAGEPSKQSA
jgi:ABC-type multidrug transport system fused ATPase/permease subunit